MTDVSVIVRPPCWCPSEGHRTFSNNARMKNRRNLDLGKVVYIPFIYNIPDSELNLVNVMVTIFFCGCVTVQTSMYMYLICHIWIFLKIASIKNMPNNYS